MAGQTWLAYPFAAVMLVTAAYCLARLVISWRQHRGTDQQVDGVHVLMGVAMAGMLIPALQVLRAGGWEVIFGAAALWFGWLTAREYRGWHPGGGFRPHHVPHVVACAAMVYMFAAVTTVAKDASGSGTSGMGGMSGAARWPALALIFALALLGHAAWTAVRLPAQDRVLALAAAAVPAAVARALSATAATVAAGPASAVADPGRTPAAYGPAPRLSALPLSPRLAACCEIAMGVVMAYALILML